VGRHTWKEGEPYDVPPVDYGVRDQICLFCGLHRSVGPENDPNGFASLPYESGTSFSFVRFSFLDCDLAQEQLRFYILGRLEAASDIMPTRFGYGVLRAMREALIGQDPAPMVYVVRAFCMLERTPGVHQLDVLWELQGGRPKAEEPPFDVDL
jgi:hypothetical protein